MREPKLQGVGASGLGRIALGRVSLGCVVLGLAVPGCSTGGPTVRADAQRAEVSVSDSGDAAAGSDSAAPLLPPTAGLAHDLFVTSPRCGQCHDSAPGATANLDEQGRSVGLFSQWSATAMGNSARDPLFRTALANEIARAPAAAGAIASVCLTCHSPMGRHAQLRAGQATTLGLVYGSGPESDLARDGVACAACHQMAAAGLGQEASFSGGYQLGTQREIYGPYAAPFANPMKNMVGYTPVQGAHLQDSALCGSCHTLVTEALTAEGKGTGHKMGEQLTYLEWRRSAYSTEGGGTSPRSCQSCHMPDAQDDGKPLQTRLARKPNGSDFSQIQPRGPFSRHTFAGANTLLPKLLRQGRAQLNPQASDAALSQAEQIARDNLGKNAAALQILGLVAGQGTLDFRVRVTNLAGHKFPSGYPSRRAFLQVEVLDAAGALLWQSGQVDAQGRLLGPNGQPLPAELPGGPYHPHRAQISAADQVLVYESVMDDGHGVPSFDLLGAEGFLKDNRLLPIGHHDETTGPLSTVPIGVSDGDFAAGSDEVALHLTLAGKPAQVRVSLRYQTFGPRYLAEMARRPTAEAAALQAMVQTGNLSPELVAQGVAAVP